VSESLTAMQNEPVGAAYSKQYQKYVIITLMIGYLFAHLDRTMIGLMVAPIQADLDISDTKMSLLMGLAFTILYSVAGVPMGYLADRWNRTRLIKCGAVIWCIMTAACGLSATYVQLFIARAFVGLGEATLMPSANSLISDYFKSHQRAKALSVYNLGIAGGSGLSLILGAWLIASLTASGGIKWGLPIVDKLAPWQIIFVFLGLSGFVFVAMMAAVKEPMRTGRDTNDAQWTAQQTLSYFRQNAKFYASLCFTMTMLSMVPYGALMWMPTFLNRIYGWSPAEAGFSFGVASLVSSVVGMIFGGWWIDRRRAGGEVDAAWRALIFGITVFVPCYVIAPLMPAAWMTIGVLVFGVFGASIATIASPTILMTGTPNEARGTAVALLGLITSIFGSGFGPTIIALLNDYVFQDPKAIGWSISIAAAIGYVGAVTGALLGLRHYGERLKAITE
jgi:MFS family permease